jgi:hypothetical protein
MPAKKGTRVPNAPRGRRKGAVNKTTRTVREAIATLVEHGMETAVAEYDRIKDPAKKLALLGAWVEYVSPRLLRTELKADLTHNVPFTGAMIDVNDPVEASRIYAEMMGTGGRDVRSVNFILSEQKPAALPKPAIALKPKQQLLRPAGLPVEDRIPPFKSQRQPQEDPVSPEISADPAPDTAVVNREDEALRHLRPPRVVT